MNVAVLSLLAGAAAPSAWPALDSEHLQRAMDATVFVKVERVYRNQTIPASGSGFFISPEGFVVTNWHVVAPQVELELFSKYTEVSTTIGDIEVVIHSGAKDELTLLARVVALDRARDLAIVSVQHHPKSWLEMAAHPTVDIATPIVAIGYPFGELVNRNKKNPAVSVTMGHVTALRNEADQADSVQIDAAVNPGNSGGPLLDQAGYVIGVISSGISGGNSTSFAISPEKLMSFLAENQVRISLEPDAVWSRATPIKVAVLPLLLPLNGVRCRYHLEGSDIDPQDGELAPTPNGFSGEIQVKPALANREIPSDYHLRFSFLSQAGKSVLEREFKLPLREGKTPQAHSDRNPADMMRDRYLLGNRTESGDPAIYLGPQPTPPSKATARTALSDIASRVKLQRPAGGDALVVTNQELIICARKPPESNYTDLTDEHARALAQQYDLAECTFVQLASDSDAAAHAKSNGSQAYYWDHTVKCSYDDWNSSSVCSFFYPALQRATGPTRDRLQEAADRAVKLLPLLAVAGICRCASGAWFNERSMAPPCRCSVPHMPKGAENR